MGSTRVDLLTMMKSSLVQVPLDEGCLLSSTQPSHRRPISSCPQSRPQAVDIPGVYVSSGGLGGASQVSTARIAVGRITSACPSAAIRSSTHFHGWPVAQVGLQISTVSEKSASHHDQWMLTKPKLHCSGISSSSEGGTRRGVMPDRYSAFYLFVNTLAKRGGDETDPKLVTGMGKVSSFGRRPLP